MERPATYTGVSLGMLIAVLVSWDLNHDIGWAILHGLLSWAYVIWAYLAYY